MELFFSALADRTRLRLINLMALDEARRDGKWMHYRLAEPPDERAARVFREVLAWLGEDAGMRRDRQSLMKVCCAPQLPVQLQGAPRPANIA